MKLRTRLNLVVTGLSAAFVTVLLAAEILSSRVSISEEIGATNLVAAQLLGRLASIYSRDGDSAPVLQFLDELGRVRANDITLISPAGKVLYRSPAATYKAGREAPGWFARLLTPDTEVQTFALPAGGRLIVEPDASRAVLDAWDDIVRLLVVAAIMLAVLNGLAFWSIGRVLKPFPIIADGLARIQRGDLSFRLPRLPGSEAHVIGEAFNGMAQAVEDKVLAERKARDAESRLEERRELGRLVEQRVEEERRLIAHELHDEFSQSVTAIRSMALAIAAKVDGGRVQIGGTGDVAVGDPRVEIGDSGDVRIADIVHTQTGDTRNAQTVDTAKLIADEAARLYDAMHGLIPRLAPLTLDTLGLGETLENLVRDWQRRFPSVVLSVRYELSSELGQSVTLAIYRVVQEGLINALRHAQASHVEIDVHCDPGRIRVTVSDDGVGLPADWSRPGHFGLRGLAERMANLKGVLDISNRPPHGVVLRAEIPLTANTHT